MECPLLPGIGKAITIVRGFVGMVIAFRYHLSHYEDWDSYDVFYDS